VSTTFSRLREVFLDDREPEQALFCTYGFDAEFFEAEILPAVCDLAPEFVQHLTAKGILSNRDPLLKALRGDVPDDYEHAQEFAQGVAPMPGPLYAVALARFAWSPVAAHVFVNRPNILTRHSYFEPTASGFALRQATDIVSNDVGVTLAGYDPFRVRLLQGVFDTNVEARIESSQPDATNPAWAFDGGGNWIGVKSPQDPHLSAIQLGGDIVSRMTSDLRTGYAVVAPSSPLAVGPGRFEGWWQIDQRTGRTLGIGPNGWGPTMAERIILWGEIAAVGFLSSYVLCKIQGGDKGDRGPGAFADPEPSGQPWLDALSPPLYARRLNPCITEGLISALQSTLFAFLDGLKWPGGGGGGPSPSGEPGGGGPGGGGPGGDEVFGDMGKKVSLVNVWSGGNFP